MAYTTSIDQRAFEMGRQQGRQESTQTAADQARREGALEALREAIADALDARFGAAPAALRGALTRITDRRALRNLHRSAVTVSSLAEFQHELGA